MTISGFDKKEYQLGEAREMVNNYRIDIYRSAYHQTGAQLGV
jgi:hypothetical protein